MTLPVYAVIKELEAPPPVDDDKMLGIKEFADGYFGCGTLFHDAEKTFVAALGNKPIVSMRDLGKAALNPLKAYRSVKNMGANLQRNGEMPTGNLKGDGLTKGGVMVVSSLGQVLHTFYEDPGQGIPEAECDLILAAARKCS